MKNSLQKQDVEKFNFVWKQYKILIIITVVNKKKKKK